MNALGVALVGVVNGLQYGLLAIGLVLIYRASRFLNLAQASIGVLSSLVLGNLTLSLGVPYVIALPIALAFGAGTGFLIEFQYIRRLASSSRLVLLVASIGIAQAVGGLGGLTWSFFGLLRLFGVKKNGGLFVLDPVTEQAKGYPVPFHSHVTIGLTEIKPSQLVTLVVAPLLAIGLAAFFSRTQTGKNIRAASSNPDAARLAGISVKRVNTIVWVLAGLLSSVAAILHAPDVTVGLGTDSAATGLLVRGLAAALLAGLVDFRVAFASGVALGVVEFEVSDHFHVKGQTDIVVLVAVVVAILIRGRTLGRVAKRGDDLLGRMRSKPVLSPRLRQVHGARMLGSYGWAALFGVLLLLPVLPGLDTPDQAQSLDDIIAFAMVGISLTVLTGWAGQLSLGQFAFAGVGAYAANEAVQQGWDVPAVVLVSLVVAGTVAVVVGLPSLRFRGLFLAASTLTFAVASASWLFNEGQHFGSTSSGAGKLLCTPSTCVIRLPFVGAFGTQRQVYLMAVVTLAILVAGLAALRRSNVGRAMVAVRDNESAASSHGLSPTATKVFALFLSGGVAGVGGAFYAFGEQRFSSLAFPPEMSLTMIGLTIIGGVTTLEGPIIGAFLVFGAYKLIPGLNSPVYMAISTSVLLLLVLQVVPDGVVSGIQQLRYLGLRFYERGLAAVPFGPVAGALPLVVRDAGISFGGLRAVDGVNIEVGPREIVGIIGGNGAGKSTLMNCISGHLPGEGTIEVFGQQVAGLAPEVRPHLGLARTFQDAHLYPGLTVRETVMVALDRMARTGAVSAFVGAPWVQTVEKGKKARALEVLDRVGLADKADVLIGELSTGMRRLCDIAVVMAADPGLVLLDEPTAGIAQREVEQFAPLLRSLRDDLGCSILIVEHDVPLMVSLCDRLYAMEEGTVLTSGKPEDVVADPRVIAAYLGGDPAAIDRSGARTPKPVEHVLPLEHTQPVGHVVEPVAHVEPVVHADVLADVPVLRIPSPGPKKSPRPTPNRKVPTP